MNIFKLVGSIYVDNTAANDSLQKTDEKAGGVGKTLGGIAGAAGKMAVGVAAAATTAGVAITTKAVSAAKDFETSFAQVSTLLDDTVNIDEYKQKIIDLSNEMGVSTDEISSAVYNAISAGQSAEDAIGFTESALKLAEGGFTDATTAVDVMTTALNAYGMSSEEAAAVSDKLIMTQNLGKTTVNELAGAMGKIIPTANSLGVDIDSLCAGYAVLTSNGIATAESTTYMNSMLNELGKSGTKADKALHELSGKGFKDLIADGESVTDVIAMLNEGASQTGLSIADMFGSAEAAKAANVLLSNTDKFNESLVKMQESAGSTEEAYSKMHNTLEAKMDTIKNNFQNVAISIGESLMPTIMKLMEYVVQMMPTITGLIEGLAPILTGLLESLMPGLMQLTESLLPVIVDCMNQILPIVSQIVESILPMLNELITMLIPPIMQIIETVLPPLIEVINVILPLFQTIIELLMPIIQLFFDLAVPIIDLAMKAVMPLIETIIELMDEVLAPLMPLITDVASVFSAVLQPVIELITPVIEVLAGVLSGVLGGAFEFIGKQVKFITGVFSGLIDFISGVFTGNWKKAFGGLKDIIKNIFDSIVNIIKAPINFIIGGVNGFIKALNKIKIPDWVPGVGGKGINIPEIPKLAKGGTIAGGGLTIVGEAGAELIDMPQGSRVTPLTQDQKNVFDNSDVINELEKVLAMLKSMPSDIARQIGAIPAYVSENDVFDSVKRKNEAWKEMTGNSALA